MGRQTSNGDRAVQRHTTQEQVATVHVDHYRVNNPLNTCQV